MRDRDIKICMVLALAAVFEIWMVIESIIASDKGDEYLHKENRMEEKYNNAFNTTTNSSACPESLDDFDNIDDCPLYPPCDDLCQEYFDYQSNYLVQGQIWAMCGFGAVVVGTFSFCFFFANCCGTADSHVCPTRDRSVNDDIESLIFVGDGSVNTSLNSTSRFLTDQSRFYKSQNAAHPPYNKDAQCPITQEDIKDLDNPVVARDGYIYECKAIKKWLVTHDTSPMTNLPMAKKLIPYNPNQESSDNQQQIVSAPRTLSRMLPIVTHTSSKGENKGRENNFTI